MFEILFSYLSFSNSVLRDTVANSAILFGFVVSEEFVYNFFSCIIENAVRHVFGSEGLRIFMSYLTFPGTFIHELSHAIGAFLTGGKVTRFCLKPSGDKLGHIIVVPRGMEFFKRWQLSFSAISPILFGLILVYVLTRIVIPRVRNYFVKGVLWYLWFCISFHMPLSPADWDLFLKGIAGSFLFITSFCFVLRIGSIFFQKDPTSIFSAANSRKAKLIQSSSESLP